MNVAKLQLSSEEMRLVMDSGVILTKNSIIKKVVEAFAALADEYRAAWAAPGPSPKISKGENYKELPYVMLDYPRLFGREDVLAIRTFFWWGHGFSITLHLKGAHRDRLLPELKAHWEVLAGAGFHVSLTEDEWQHEHTEENYRPLVRADDLETEGEFLKLSAACGPHRWEEAPEILTEFFRVLVGVLVA
ncbi:MAG: hypothetical protein JST68_21390 [Bacteroidetes bacterium]|nr:hypothetical protein [Bacteroidota bacterium]